MAVEVAAGLAAASGADTAVVDTPEIPDVDANTSDDGASGGESTDGLEPVTGDDLVADDADADPAAKAAAEAKGDGRTLPAELKKSLAELQKTNPAMAEQIRKDYFKTRQYEQIFKTPAEAKQVADVLANVTGLNGETGVQAIEALQADAQEFNDEITAFAQGDPSLLAKLATQSPEGFVKLVPHALKLFKEKSPQEYGKLEEGIMDTAFAANNVYPHVQALIDSIVSDDQGARAESLRLAKALQGWLAAKQGKGNAPIDKDREAFQTEKQKWEETKATEAQQKFEKDMYGGLNPVVTNKVKAHLAALLPKGYKLPEATENRILQTIFSQIDTKLQEKPDYLTRAEAIFKTKDLKRVTNFMLSRIDPLLLPLTKAVYGEFRGVVPTKKAAAPGTKTGTQAGAQAQKGVQARKPTLDEAQRLGFSKEEWVNSLSKKKLEKAGKTYFAW